MSTPMNGLYKQLGKKVREARVRAGFTQEGLAKKAGLHRTYIAGIETGRRNISVKNLEKIAKALGVKTNDLL
jgi:transcriptional regulator with XRE-family HTH domain